ncbi:PREDICTED: zinc finger CCCH domain-containing protein 55-like isoform X3 [Nicotiana attenuata]|uniref:zinc finger CCCH domain-containing protein 55-like isoform X2 n=1 Tax=Nicotiana attenuata TaxID=49451 RepID=UPI0009050099|nr:PREDICTED: zinc finger CCCH domain-containing protein 55-like isoform X2 [Nicotiana attenuata]XP_019233750.1 PREDICTED: zinc finger CCCH domain-containing protein 55-like isoform X3 [Nicotiana attenuata]
MGESAKRRKSLWDAEETPNSPDYEEWGASKADNSWQSKNNSGWSCGDNVTGTEELRKENYHYKSMSPAFDRWGRRSNSHSPNNGRTQSRRYPGRARSRSRSRSRSRARGEGRSRSRSRGRDRFRGWTRSRSRSKSRDRDRGSMRVQNRSRSPLHNSKRDPYASGDRRSGPRMSSQVCRNFTAGNCRRGSDCRFFHPDAINHRDGGHSEGNLTERLGSRPERGHVSRYADSEGPGYQSRDRLPDTHHLEDEMHRNRNRGTIICRDFVKGNCRWGASCRFSHDGASGDIYDKGTRSASFDHGQDNHASRTGKSVCKYFAAGKCYKDNCKFSHDATSRNHEIRPSDDIGGHRLDDKNNWLKGPKWDDEGRPSDLVKASGWDEGRPSDHVKSSGWDESVVRKDTAVTVLTDRTNERLDHSFENESRAWGSTEPHYMNSDGERGVSPHGGNAGNLNALNISESSVIQKLTNAQAIHLTSQASDQNMERTSAHVLGHNSNPEASGIILSATATQPYGSASSYIQPQGLIEDSIARTLGSNALNEFMHAREGLHQVHLPGQSFSGTGIGMSSEHSAVLNGTHQEPNVFLPIPSTGHNKREAPSTPEMLEFKVPQNISCTVTGEQVHQTKTSPTSMIKKFEEELREAQLQRVLNPSDPSGMLASHPISSLVNAIYGQTNPEMRGPNNYHPADGVDNFKMPPDNSSYLDRDSNKVPEEQMNQLSTVDPEPGNNDQIDDVKQQENKFVEVNGKDKLAPVESKDGQENDHPGDMNMHGKVEEGSGNKDEKAMRLFKNALIEFVKEILKPTWKEGKMSREVHKTVVKKVVDKVTSTTQGEHVPKTQEKIEQYLSYSKAKITKLVQAYVERLLKNEA